MKRVILLSALFLFTATTLISCRQTTEKETVIREVKVEKEVEKIETTEERKGAFERAAERVDSEVNKKIDKEIDKIGDDN